MANIKKGCFNTVVIVPWCIVVAYFVFITVKLMMNPSTIHDVTKNERAFDQAQELTKWLEIYRAITNMGVNVTTYLEETNKSWCVVNVASFCSNNQLYLMPIDPWGHQYNAMMVNTDVNWVVLGDGSTVKDRHTVAWSNGENGSNEYGHRDDINSWETEKDNCNRLHWILKYIGLE